MCLKSHWDHAGSIAILRVTSNLNKAQGAGAKGISWSPIESLRQESTSNMGRQSKP